jgi:hypothetical protein
MPVPSKNRAYSAAIAVKGALLEWTSWRTRMAQQVYWERTPHPETLPEIGRARSIRPKR